jgi:hypothetical protein
MSHKATYLHIRRHENLKSNPYDSSNERYKL